MTKKILYLITSILFLTLCFLIYDFWSFKNDEHTDIEKKGEKITKELTREINSVLKAVMNEAQTLVILIDQRNYTKEELEQLIMDRSQNMDEILGITIAFEPYTYNDTTQLYSPYFDKNQNRIIRLESSYDYTNSNLKTAQWYTQPRAHGAQWIEPYYGQVSKTLVSDYSIPFYHQKGVNKGKMKGIIAVTISLKGFTKLVHSLSLGKTGFGFVSSSKGTFLAHPVNEYIGRKNISEITKTETRKELNRAYQSILDGKTGYVEFQDKTKKQNTLFFYDKVVASNWGIGILFFKNDMLGGEDHFKRKYIHIAIITSLLSFFLLALIFNRDFLSVSEIWYLSLFATFVLILNIVFLGYLQHTENNTLNGSETPPISDHTTLSNFVNEQNTRAKNISIESPIIVPTGIYLERLEFEDSYHLNISGKLWQKYDTIALKTLRPGFRFPQIAPFAESSFIEESYKEYFGDQIVIGYDFRTTVRLNFEYSNYPFDKRHINLEIQPVDTKNKILLVPDLKSYAYTNPSQKSGIDADIKLPGSEIIESYFTYKTNIYNTNFGYENRDDLAKHTMLHFNVNVKRILVTAFVTYLIPIFVTLIMLFILICATEKSKDKQAGGGIVQGLAAFFFVLIFSHIDLRKDILTADLVYMEYFYFVAYIMIILATYNLITYTRTTSKLFDYKKNLIVKSTFWPTFLFLVLIITLIKFY